MALQGRRIGLCRPFARLTSYGKARQAQEVIASPLGAREAVTYFKGTAKKIQKTGALAYVEGRKRNRTLTRKVAQRKANLLEFTK